MKKVIAVLLIAMLLLAGCGKKTDAASDLAYVQEKGTLVVGSRVFEDIKRQLRWRACHPKTNVQSDGPMDKAEGLVLFSVSDSKKAADCLRQQLGWVA